MAKVEKYKILSPFPSKGKVFAKHGEIVSSKDLALKDIDYRLANGYIEKVIPEVKKEEPVKVEDPKEEAKSENTFNPFKKKKKRK